MRDRPHFLAYAPVRAGFPKPARRSSARPPYWMGSELRLAHHEHGRGRVPGKPLRDAAQEEAVHPALAVGAEEEEVRLLALHGRDEVGGGVAAGDLGADFAAPRADSL